MNWTDALATCVIRCWEQALELQKNINPPHNSAGLLAGAVGLASGAMLTSLGIKNIAKRRFQEAADDEDGCPKHGHTWMMLTLGVTEMFMGGAALLISTTNSTEPQWVAKDWNECLYMCQED